VLSLAYATAFLHSKGLYHFGLSPEMVLVRFDEKLNIPRILLFDLGLVSDTAHINANWYRFFTLPAYTAPELISNGKIRPEYATDVYGLGLTLYELLVGEPAFNFKLQSDAEVYRAVQRNRIAPMNRVEDVKMVADIAIKAVDPDIARRQPDATVLAKQLLDYFGTLPPEKKSRWPSVKTLLIIVAALLAIAFLIAVAVSFNNFMG
jgi:serine/threonine protein kinase